MEKKKEERNERMKSFTLKRSAFGDCVRLLEIIFPSLIETN